jgi:membrane fusion protein, multidrug efflux system
MKRNTTSVSERRRPTCAYEEPFLAQVGHLRSNALALLALLLAATSHAAAPVDVKVAMPARGDIHRFVTLPGTIKANQQATLYAKVGGYLTSLTVDKGDAVKAGQALGEIEVPELLAERVKHVAEVKVAEIDFKRITEAQRKAPDLVVPQTVAEAEGRLEIARAMLERTDTLLRYAKLTAPFAGIVIARHVDPGAFIPAATSGSAANSAAVVTIADFNTVRAQVPVPAAEASRVKTGQPVRITVEGLAGRTFEGKVSRHSHALDETTQTLLVEADLPNADGALRPGMFATIKVGVELHTGALLIPAEALVMEKANAFVFLNAGGKAKKTAIKAGFNDGAKVEVLDGLKGGESVILVGKLALADGAAINATEVK